MKKKKPHNYSLTVDVMLVTEELIIIYEMPNDICLVVKIALGSQAMYHVVNPYLSFPFSLKKKTWYPKLPETTAMYTYFQMFFYVGTKCKSPSMHRWRSPEIWFFFKLADSCVNTACDVCLSGGLLKNYISFAVICSYFKDKDFHCSSLKIGKRPMFL